MIVATERARADKAEAERDMLKAALRTVEATGAMVADSTLDVAMLRHHIRVVRFAARAALAQPQASLRADERAKALSEDRVSDLAFLDLETTGLDPARHEIIEAAVIRVDGRTLEELDSVNVRIAPLHIETADPDALRVNGFDASTWGGGSLEEALLQVEPLLADAILAGQNVARFDLPFLEVGCRAVGLDLPRSKYVIDVASLCWPLYQRGLVESLSLSALCDYYGISNVGAHGALADARRALEVARRVLGTGPPCHCQLEIGDRPCPRHGDTECQTCGAMFVASQGHECPRTQTQGGEA